MSTLNLAAQLPVELGKSLIEGYKTISDGFTNLAIAVENETPSADTTNALGWEYFYKCTRASWQLPSHTLFGIQFLMLLIYVIVLISTNKRSKALQSILWAGLILNLIWLPLFMTDARLGAIVLPILIVMAFNAQLKLVAEKCNKSAGFMTVYILWLSYILSFNAVVAIGCPKVL